MPASLGQHSHRHFAESSAPDLALAQVGGGEALAVLRAPLPLRTAVGQGTHVYWAHHPHLLVSDLSQNWGVGTESPQTDCSVRSAV